MLETAGCTSLLAERATGDPKRYFIGKMAFFGVSVRFQKLANKLYNHQLLLSLKPNLWLYSTGTFKQTFRMKTGWKLELGAVLVLGVLAILASLSASRLRVSDGFPVGAIAAQLGAYDEVPDARRDWTTLKRKFGAQLDQLEPVVTRVECASDCTQYDDREFFRLRVGSFANLEDARAFCEALAAELQSCIPLKER